MGEYSSTTLDRDRAFDINSLNELLTQGKSILTEADRISRKMEASILAIAGIYGGIDGEYKVGALGSDIASLSGTLKKDIYRDTMDRMDKILNKLINDIPAYDNTLAQSMGNIQEALHSIKGRISELKGLLETGDISLSYTEFSQRLKDLKAGWDRTTEDLSELLAEIENDMLGVSAAAAQYSKDPVNLSTGNFVYDHEDMKISGEIPLSFHRYYNAKDRTKGSLGRCFVHNYESHLEENTEKGKITVSMGDGQKKTFRKAADGIYQSLHSATETLIKEGENHILTNLTGERTVYNKTGQMVRRENRYERGTTFTYDGKGRLEKAETDNGALLTYSYNEAGQLIRVTDHTGRSVELVYEKGKLATVKNPAGSTYAYHYGKNGRIEETASPRGYATVRNTYDEKRRVTRQEFPDGGQMKYAYDDQKRQVTLTERNGSKAIYIHDSRYRNTDILYEDGTKEHFEYNGKNQRILYTDRNGNTTRMSYDNRGNLTQVINALGEKLSITFDANNKPTNIKINGKEKQKNTYDKKGNLLETKDALGRKTSFSYNEKGLLGTITQPDGSVIRMTYDGRGNIETVTDAMGGAIHYDYDTLNRVIEVTDPEGSTAGFAYDKAGNITAFTNAEGNKRTYEYNESGKVTKITDFDGSAIQRTYNVLNKPETITDRQGRQTKLTYDAMWNLARITTPDGATTTCLYNQNNRLSRIKDPAGNVTRYTYDGNGNCTAKQDPEGNITRYTYDAIGRLTHVTGPDGAEMTYAYDEEGRLIKAEDALGNTLTMQYDEAGQLIKETNPLGDTRTYTYTPLGKIRTVTDEAGRTTAYAYFPGGRLSEVTYSDGTKETYAYDPNGNIKTHTTKEGNTLTYTYDSLDRIIKIQGSQGEKKQYTYDPVGNVTSMTDPKGNTTRYEYSPTGKLTKVTDPMGNETEYTYDLCDRLIRIEQYGEEQQNPPGSDENPLEAESWNKKNRPCHVTRYQRNILGQVETITDALGNTEHYTYDPKGQLLKKLDKEGYLTQYAYTPDGDLSRIQYADGREVKLSYTPLRHLEEIKDWLGTTTIHNDPLGRALKVQYPDGRETSYTYGKTGERTSVTYPDGTTIRYRYDENIRLTALEDGKDTIAYAYDSLGRLIQKTFPNACRTDYAYDREGHLAELTHSDREGILDRYAYQYDLAGNKTLIEKHRRGLPEESGLYAYGYDPLGRLTRVTKDGQPLRTYEYDPFGNRTRMIQPDRETAYTYNALNQLISRADATTEETYAYDRRGNLSLILENGSVKNTYTYGALNRLELAVNATGEAAAYEYNGLGHRVRKTIGTARLQMAEAAQLPDPMESLKQHTPDPETDIRYTIDLTRGYHNLLQKEEAGTIQTYLWDGNVAAMKEQTTAQGPMTAPADLPCPPVTRYYLQDELGSPLRLLDGQGCLTETYGYDEFGQDLYGNREGTAGRNMTGSIQPFGYTGYQTDRIAGTYYAQAREYRAETGRFDGRDIIKGNIYYPKTMNLYQYCINSPLRYIDPSGNDYIIAWSYNQGDDVKGFERYYYRHHFIDAVNKDIKIDGQTDDWTDEMWSEFDARSSYARAANTRYDELVDMGVPEDEIHVVRIDGKEDLVQKWNSWTEYDSIQSLDFYTHGFAGRPEVYKGSDNIFTDGSLEKLNWAVDEYTIVPQMTFHGCHTATDTTQMIANYFGVQVSGNRLATSFSNNKIKFERIDNWGTSHDVYLGTYGTYDDGTFWFDETSAISYIFQRVCGVIAGRYLCPLKTYYPECLE